jgi:Tol biopolymer transport system component
MTRLRIAVALAASITAVLVPWLTPAASGAAAPFDNHISVVSVADPEVYPGAGGSFARAISDDGRFVVFLSEQPHLVAAPPPSSGRHYYVRDLVAGTTTRIGRDIEGPYPGSAAISGNGRFIVFPSQDSAADQAVLRILDRTTGKLRVVSSSSTPVSAGIDWYTAAISDNGRVVVYTRSYADGAGEVVTEMYRYDTSTRVTNQPVPGNLAGPSIQARMAAIPSLSADGRYLAYVLPTGPGPDAAPFELVRIDLTTGDRLVVDTSRPQYHPKEVFGQPTLSNTGRFLAHYRIGILGGTQVYQYDAMRGTLTLVSHRPDGQPSGSSASEAQISGDGRYVIFFSVGTDLVAGPPQGVWMLYRWDRSTGTVDAMIRNLRGSYPHSYTAGASSGSIDGDGSTIAFAATSAQLVVGADNRLERTYVWQR